MTIMHEFVAHHVSNTTCYYKVISIYLCTYLSIYLVICLSIYIPTDYMISTHTHPLNTPLVDTNTHTHINIMLLIRSIPSCMESAWASQHQQEVL